MLKFPNQFTDGETNELVKKNVNRGLQAAIFKYIDDPEGFDPKEIFPEDFPEEDMEETLKALYSLLNADDEFVPTPAMEYAMYRALEYEIDLVKCFSKDELMAQNNTTADDEVKKDACDSVFNVPFTAETEKSIEEGLRKWMDTFGWDSKGDYDEIFCDKMESFWKYTKDWLDFCFWDEDFLALDTKTPEMLRKVFIPMLNEDAAAQGAYILPEDWIHSKKFRFKAEERIAS